MVSKVKPIRMNITGTPTAGKIPAYVSPDEMEWVEQTGGAGGITAYTIDDGTMNGTTPVVISDSRIELDTPFNIYYESEPVGNITRTLGAGTITVVSDDPADTMDFRLVIFGFGNKTTYVQSGVETLDGAGPRVITDSRISADTPVNLFPLQEPTGYLTIVAGDGEVTITSSASETNLEVRYIGFTELSVGSILNDAYGVAWATDETNGASRKAIYDKIESLEGEIGSISGQVSGLDGIITDTTQTYFKSGYRGALEGNWGVAGYGAWYKNNIMYITNGANISKYNLLGTLIDSDNMTQNVGINIREGISNNVSIIYEGKKYSGFNTMDTANGAYAGIRIENI